MEKNGFYSERKSKLRLEDLISLVKARHSANTSARASLLSFSH